MEWTDEGIVLGVRRHGETGAVLELMTRERGRHLGLVRGGAGTRMRSVLQPGNTVRAVWRARLDEHLGQYTVEGLRLRTGDFLPIPYATFGLTHLCALTRLLPERDPHPDLLEDLEVILDAFGDPHVAAIDVARFELHLLTELGFGLDLSECAATGVRTELIYVSPKSGRAVSREAGRPWQDKLLRLPAFLGDPSAASEVSADDLACGFALTGFFLTRYVFEPRGLALPDARASFVTAIARLLPLQTLAV